MKCKRLALCTLTAVLGVGMSVVSAGIASASLIPPPGTDDHGGGGGGGDIGRLRPTGSCGDMLDLRVQKSGDPLRVGITIPAADPTEVWTITVTEQNYDAVTGGRIGNPIDLMAGVLPPLAFDVTEGGFSTEGQVVNTTGLTHGFSYTAVRSSPTPLTCTNQGQWTSPAGSQGPVAQNPSGRPDTPPALTGATEADAGTNDVELQFDQEMLATAAGTPDANRFVVTVDGVSRTATGVSIADAVPPGLAIADITFAGAALTAGQTVTVQYLQPVTGGAPALQDLESLQTPGFGPVSVTAF
jgi:hypothetical protein